MSARRELVMAFIKSYVAEHGYPPNYREIAKGTGLRSNAGVAHHLEALIREGRIRREPMAARAITVVESAS